MTDFKVKLNYFFDFFLPRLCASCKKSLSPIEEIVCDDCYYKLEIADSCIIESEYKIKFAQDKFIEDYRAGFLFQQDMPIQHIIHSLKYDKKFSVGIYLGRLISKLFFEHITKWNADLIIPVPLHRLKKLDRGYNQSEFIAKGISKELKIPYAKNLVKRVKFTQTQTQLNLIQRKENVKNAFKVINSKYLKRKNIILVDDVVTTGSTVNECAQVIKESGAEKIYALFIAIAYQ